MNSSVLVYLLLFSYASFSLININTTAPSEILANEAQLLIGLQTSQFPNEAFLNFILYGHTNVPFKYNDFLASFGIKTEYLREGYIVVGNDGKLGGVAIDTFEIILPVPGGLVTKTYLSQLGKYFPFNYTILETTNYKFDRAMGGATTRFKGVMICTNNCSSDISTANDDYLFLDNNFYGIDIFGKNSRFESVLFCYLSQFYSGKKAGLLKITSYFTIDSIGRGHFNLTDFSQLNQVSLVLMNNTFYIHGSTNLIIGDDYGTYEFNGTLPLIGIY